MGWGAGPPGSQELGGGGGAGIGDSLPEAVVPLLSSPLRPLGFSRVRGKGAGSRGVPLTAAEEADRLTDT